MRPGTNERWSLAYYQAYLYAAYIERLGGNLVLAQMLDLYGQGVTTEEIISKLLGTTIHQFEDGYRGFLQRRVRESGVVTDLDSTRPVEELKQLLKSEADDAAIWAELAEALMLGGNRRSARRAAQRAIDLSASQPRANYVLAGCLVSGGDEAAAGEWIDRVLDKENPDARLLRLAAQLHSKARRFAKSADLYRLGQRHFPRELDWTKRLARVLLLQGNDADLTPVLATLADRQMDEPALTRKLTQLALRQRDYRAAERWANRTLHIDVTDPAAHAAVSEGIRRAESIAGSDSRA